MEKTFEESLKELESLVHDLESGETPLEEAINKYTEAMKLSKECSDKLNNATEAVNKILNKDGELEDFKISEGE